MGTEGSLKRPGREADHSTPFIAEVKNGGAMPLVSHLSLWRDTYLIKHKDNFTFYILYSRNVSKIHGAD
jgi:hypothetical protein